MGFLVFHFSLQVLSVGVACGKKKVRICDSLKHKIKTSGEKHFKVLSNGFLADLLIMLDR